MMPSPAPEPTDATTAEVAPPKVKTLDKVRPRSNRILIRPEPLSKSVGKIALPDTASELDEGRHWSGLTVRTAKVIAIGPGIRVTYDAWRGYRDEEGIARWPTHGIKPGDRILYRAWSGNDVTIDNEKLVVITSNVVDAIILEDGRLDLVEDRMLVRRRKRIEKTKGGIWIPEIAQKEPLEGEVLQIGTGKILATGV